MFSISPSKLEKYLRCPREYKFEYIDGLRQMYHKDTPPLIIGSLIHGVLNDFYKRIPKENRNIDELRKIFKNKFLTHGEKHLAVFKNQEEVNEYVKKAVRQLENFLNHNLSKREPFLAPERNPKIEIDKQIELTGRLDRVDELEEELHIIDYKTGKKWEDEPDSLQLDFYSLLVSRLFPNKKIARKIYYYLDTNELVEIPLREGEHEETLGLIKNTYKQIQNDKQFEARKNDKCRFCDYKAICDLYKEHFNENPPF